MQTSSLFQWLSWLGRRHAVCLLGVLLAGSLPGQAAAPKDTPVSVLPAEPEAAPVTAPREPLIRHLDRRADAADRERVWYFRKKLPEKFYRRNNFGWARADIEGLDKKEYFAHSGIQNFDGMSKRVAQRIKDISFSPERGHGKFKTLFVDYLGNTNGPNAIPRWFDTEYKMLEDIAARLPDPSVTGKIRLYTNLEPCPSCRSVMQQFMAMYTNVDLEVLYEWP